MAAGYRVTEVTDADWARFEPKVARSGDCHVWAAKAHTSKGYGMFGMGGRSGRPIVAHRVAWVRTHGPIPDGMFVLHHCDNPPCVNVDHLFLGTNADNMADCSAKGRYSKHNSKLTPEQVRQVRALHRSGQRAVALAEMFGLSRRAVSNLVAGRTYGWVL